MTNTTPGPWRWEVSLHSKTAHIRGGRPPYDLTVIDFVRWGMGGAAPRFREHHEEWFRDVDHPDARLIVAAPDLLESLREVMFMGSDPPAAMGGNCESFYRMQLHSCIGIAARAIAKAEGK